MSMTFENLQALMQGVEKPAAKRQLVQVYRSQQITVRDHFAAVALQGLLTCNYTRDELAKVAYEIADAMVAARGTLPEGDDNAKA